MIFHNNYVLICILANDVRKDSFWPRISLKFPFGFSWWLVILSMVAYIGLLDFILSEPPISVCASSCVYVCNTISLCSSDWPRTHNLLLAPASWARLTPHLAIYPFLIDLPVFVVDFFVVLYIFWTLMFFSVSTWQRCVLFIQTVSVLIMSLDLKKLFNSRNPIWQFLLFSVFLKPFLEIGAMPIFWCLSPMFFPGSFRPLGLTLMSLFHL